MRTDRSDTMKYAIQVLFDGKWIYLTRGRHDNFDLEVITWDSAEEARSARSEMFKVMGKVRIVEYRR